MSERAAFGRKSVMTRVVGPGEAETAAAAAASAAFAPAEEKYEFAGSIGQGGMGEVLLVEDRDLKRQVAMKVLREALAKDPAHRLRFVAEAQATSQLEHPGIPPVHDIGIQPSGQVYFTMKLVRGRTLGEILRDLLLGAKTVRREYTPHKLISVLERVCEALHFAHEQGVIHRDLKPENIMLGEYGEVHVMDWGIAKLAAAEEDADEAGWDDFGDDAALATSGADALQTQAGAIKGTIPYMSPEQARGEPLDRRCDVYALGCLLYEILTLHAAFEGDGVQLLLRVRKGDFVPVTERNPKRTVPVSLAELCTRSMAHDPAGRPESAAAFGAELRAWLDGRAERSRKHAEAEALAATGIASLRRHAALRTEAEAAEEKAAAMAGDFEEWQPVAEKRALVAARRAATDLRREMAIAFADATALLNAALAAEEGNTTATRALGDLWAARLAESEARGEADDAAHALAMLTRYDAGRHTRLIAGDGSLELTSDPPGAQVVLFRFEQEDGVLVPTDERSLGATPVAEVSLAMGSYLCILRKAGFRDVRYPVHITRGGHWNGAVRMRTDAEIGADCVLVPGGPFVYGEGKDATRKELPDFAIAKYPVTFGEYGEFLRAIEAEQGLEAAAERLPRTQTDGALMERGEDGVYRPVESLIDGPVRERYEREYGADFLVRLPVVAVTWHEAVAYCEWRTRATAREWRLPSEEEREKAARGVDGRRFPWGDLADASLCKNSHARAEASQPEPVGTFPTAASVYEMGDAAGNVWDWTSSLYEPHVTASSSRVLRGGSWNLPVGFARAAYRNWNTPEFRNTNLGFRPASPVTS